MMHKHFVDIIANFGRPCICCIVKASSIEKGLLCLLGVKDIVQIHWPYKHYVVATFMWNNFFASSSKHWMRPYNWTSFL